MYVGLSTENMFGFKTEHLFPPNHSVMEPKKVNLNGDYLCNKEKHPSNSATSLSPCSMPMHTAVTELKWGKGT